MYKNDNVINIIDIVRLHLSKLRLTKKLENSDSKSEVLNDKYVVSSEVRSSLLSPKGNLSFDSSAGASFAIFSLSKLSLMSYYSYSNLCVYPGPHLAPYLRFQLSSTWAIQICFRDRNQLIDFAFLLL
jgi:hypothetical protein